MRNLYNMASAGMMLSLLISAVQNGEFDETVKDYETRKYLTEKLEEAFFSIQSDITEAVVSVAQNLAEDEEK